MGNTRHWRQPVGAVEREILRLLGLFGRGRHAAAHLVFQRAGAAKATVPTSSGAGLGLTISKLAIDQMDGQLALHSQPDHGSIFTIALHTAELATSRSPGSLGVHE